MLKRSESQKVELLPHAPFLCSEVVVRLQMPGAGDKGIVWPGGGDVPEWPRMVEQKRA